MRYSYSIFPNLQLNLDPGPLDHSMALQESRAGT